MPNERYSGATIHMFVKSDWLLQLTDLRLRAGRRFATVDNSVASLFCTLSMRSQVLYSNRGVKLNEDHRLYICDALTLPGMRHIFQVVHVEQSGIAWPHIHLENMNNTAVFPLDNVGLLTYNILNSGAPKMWFTVTASSSGVLDELLSISMLSVKNVVHKNMVNMKLAYSFYDDELPEDVCVTRITQESLPEPSSSVHFCYGGFNLQQIEENNAYFDSQCICHKQKVDTESLTRFQLCPNTDFTSCETEIPKNQNLLMKICEYIICFDGRMKQFASFDSCSQPTSVSNSVSCDPTDTTGGLVSEIDIKSEVLEEHVFNDPYYAQGNHGVVKETDQNILQLRTAPAPSIIGDPDLEEEDTQKKELKCEWLLMECPVCDFTVKGRSQLCCLLNHARLHHKEMWPSIKTTISAKHFKRKRRPYFGLKCFKCRMLGFESNDLH